MRLRLVKFGEVRGEALTRSYKDETHILTYDQDRRAIRLEHRVTGEIWYADQAGAEWYPMPETRAADRKEPERGGPATPVARQPAPVAQRPKR